MKFKFFACVCALPILASAAVLDEVSFTIQEGWNAVYLPVTPMESADSVFACWPTDKVGFYDQAAFLRTKQFETKANETTLGAVENGMKLWFRGEPGKSTFRSLMANGIYVFNATNEMPVTVRGVPEAMRISWHVSVSTNQPLNFVGISTDGSEAELTEAGYFRGLDTGWTYAEGVVRDLWGFDETPTADFFYGGVPTKGNLGVVAMDAPKASDWSGALNVSPANGIALGTNGCQTTLSVRNDGGTNRLVIVSLRQSANGLSLPAILRYAPLEAQWKSFDAPYECELKAGETLALRLAVDRAQFANVPSGTEYGAIVDVTDVSAANPTRFHTAVPFSVESDGGGFAGTAWPKGLWRVDLSLDRVADKKAGATMTARVLVHVDVDGKMNLMQRARVGARRVSSVVLPVDQPILSGSGTFGSSADFTWTVGEKSRVNPFYHAKHPDHDGLDWDFKDTLPSGDNFTNYVATVKPELFSISNRLEFAWDANTGAKWNPAERLTGDCTWHLYGLRHEHNATIKAGGRFTMQRLSEEGLEAVKEEF